MNQAQLLKRLDERWLEFLTSFSGLSDKSLLTPGVTAAWSVRDLMAHVTTWEGEALKALPLVLGGKRLPRYISVGGIDAFNAGEQERKRSASLQQIRQDLEATHGRLVTFLQGVPPAAYASEGRFLKRLRLDTYGHYREHTKQIQLWRKSHDSQGPTAFATSYKEE